LEYLTRTSSQRWQQTQAFRLTTVEMHNLNQVNQAIAEIPSILLAMISQTTNHTKPIRHNTNIKHKS
jgi:hypothetical protein